MWLIDGCFPVKHHLHFVLFRRLLNCVKIKSDFVIIDCGSSSLDIFEEIIGKTFRFPGFCFITLVLFVHFLSWGAVGLFFFSGFGWFDSYAYKQSNILCLFNETMLLFSQKVSFIRLRSSFVSCYWHDMRVIVLCISQEHACLGRVYS